MPNTNEAECRDAESGCATTPPIREDLRMSELRESLEKTLEEAKAAISDAEEIRKQCAKLKTETHQLNEKIAEMERQRGFSPKN